MKSQSQNDYYCTIAQLCKTNKFEAFDTAREQKKPSDFACEAGCSQRFWCGPRPLSSWVQGLYEPRHSKDVEAE